MEEEETCRICLESSPISCSYAAKLSDSIKENQLISPCACTGTQAFVHLKCLRRWQRAVMSSRLPGAGHTPALICSVCTSRFTVAPPKPPLTLQLWKVASAYAWEAAGLFMIMCACYMALTGHNVQSLIDELESRLALAREVLPCSIRFNVWEDKCLSPACSLLGGRLGSGRPHLHPGTLLVATPAMPSAFFFGSVVLLYEHQRCSGSRGLVLNMQAQEAKVGEWEKDVIPRVRSRALLKNLSHGIGGPLAEDEWMILHRCQLSLEKCGICSHKTATAKTPCGRGWGQEMLPGVYLGRDISPLILQEKSEVFPLTHQVLHGHAEWYVGQLGSEIRRGLWVTKENTSDILISTPPLELWHALVK
ncbi:hypothetical protein O6H91_12G026800 [Diphasiastrum complanatum]|uniref:Uncharacterized protein n=1 Tax=Diphasiastrum complanatum TaxID=34168 RepID=A0ACC2BZT9_DIPCM|nr:hypothetical protein O6H91_12G026800 [Diphasiastrum complanatum]